ncbi:hypothetical protein [Desulfosporosinus youngiae]|uniref:hypothetical protein n=1 Tax=Desulfosporosinus youngiae TaxID=339862 RepID=UPI00145D62C4|nr:hypothetical protein [Desulfosporosinus youngiae]
MHGETLKSHKPARGNVATGSHQRYYPEVWHESVRWTVSPKRLSTKNTYPLKVAPTPVSGQASEC